jgi:prepilin-type N-terminal cleavage/methylation domain-containing protein
MRHIKQRGFTIIEVMVAVAIGSAVALGLATSFDSTLKQSQ